MKYKLKEPIKASIGMERYQCSVEWRNGHFVVDEPVSFGGRDAGPDPISLFLSSVASCTLVTLRMYIDRKGWDIPEIGCVVNMFQTKDGEKVTSIIDRDLRVLQPLTDEQRHKLTEIAQACPISRLMEGDIQVRTQTYHLDQSTGQAAITNGELIVVTHAELAKKVVDHDLGTFTP